VSENIKRVWQYIPDFVRYIDEGTDEIKYRRKDNMSYPRYTVTFGSNQIIDGVQIKKPEVVLKATPMGQYVVEHNHPQYDLIVKVMAKYVEESNGKLKEISQLVADKKTQLGELPIEFQPKSSKTAEVVALEKKLADAQAQVAALSKK